MSAGAVLLGTAFAILVIAAATIAVSTRDARIAVIGLLAAILAAPFLAEPVPDLRGITARLAGGALGVYPLWMLYRDTDETTTGSSGGWVIDGIVAVIAGLAAASAAVGWDVSGAMGNAGLGPLAAQLGQIGTALQRPFLPAVGAGGALLVLAVSPVAFAREPLRLTLGLAVGLLGLTLVWAGLAGPPTPFTDLCVAIVIAAVCAGGAVVVAASRRAARPLPRSEGLRALPPLHLPHRPNGHERSPRPRPAVPATGQPANNVGSAAAPAVTGESLPETSGLPRTGESPPGGAAAVEPGVDGQGEGSPNGGRRGTAAAAEPWEAGPPRDARPITGAAVDGAESEPHEAEGGRPAEAGSGERRVEQRLEAEDR